jgi:hypothetical protein
MGVYWSNMNYTFTLLTTADSIGDTLSAINQNYLNLDSWLNSIQLSADQYWTPFVDFYKNFKLELKPNIDKSNLVVSKWKEVSTVVESNSSKWLEPLILYYPFLIDESNQTFINTVDITPSMLSIISQWLNSNFPILNDNCYNGVCYLENQEAIIHLILKNKPRIDDDKFEISDSTTCNTSNTIASGPCTVTFSGNVTNCNKGTYHCGGSRTCNVTQSIQCFFPDGRKTNQRSITAYLNYNFTDTYENDKILRLKYIVSNCSWIFNSKI